MRIELGEIEAGCEGHPRVRQAVVTAPGRGFEDRRLVAYVVAAEREGERGADPDELRRFLAEKLPAALLPAAWVMLPALPLTPNGKIDRRALPDPAAAGVPGRAARAPQNPIEEAVLETCSAVLAGRPVRLEDNFFELGGNSINAIHLVSRLRQRFGIDLPLARIFALETVGGLAAAVLQAAALLETEAEDRAELEALLGELEEMSDDQARDSLVEGGSRP